MTNLVVDLARGHALGHDHFANHRRPALNGQLVVHGEWRNTAFSVTLGAILGDDRGDIGCVGQSGSVNALMGNRSAACFQRNEVGILTSDQAIDRLRQFVLYRSAINNLKDFGE